MPDITNSCLASMEFTFRNANHSRAKKLAEPMTQTAFALRMSGSEAQLHLEPYRLCTGGCWRAALLNWRWPGTQ